jgi:hypothetical protein
MQEDRLVALYARTLDGFLRRLHQRFMESNRLSDRWEEFESHFRALAERHRGELLGLPSSHERHSVLKVKITKRLFDLLEEDALYQALMAGERSKDRLRDAVARLDYDIWNVRLLRLRMKVMIYLLEAETDDFLKEEDRYLYERFRNRQRAQRNPIYWRGAGMALMEPTDDMAALRYLRDTDTALMTRHAGALHTTFDRLRNDAHGLLNYFNRQEFYGCLGRSAKAVLDRDAEAGERDLILAVLAGVSQLLSGWTEHYFLPGTLNVVDEEKLKEMMTEVRCC